MNTARNFFVSLLLIASFSFSALPCGPSYVTPIFQYEHAPENPFANFAAGRIGIVKPTQRRIVLIAAYRYLNGGGWSQAEQKALVEVWEADFNNKPFETDDVADAVKKWVAARKSVAVKEEKVPEIYVEREYGGYDFFPNCTQSSFETATATLADRAASHGSEDPGVRNWLAAQDRVFENCASGKSDPGEPDDAMPEWLRKDRAYQKAAAEFYALDYASARRRFAAIAQDADSPWRDTADYLVGRTLVREASLTRDKLRAGPLYAEAEQVAQRIGAGGGKFAEAAQKLVSLIKYRTRPEERVRELAQNIAFKGGDTFRQDLVDYNWLMDKFEKETLEAEEKRKAEPNAEATPVPTPDAEAERQEKASRGELMSIGISLDDQSYRLFYAAPGLTEAEVVAQIEQELGRKLSEKELTQVSSAVKTEFASTFSKRTGATTGYEGGYWGSEKMTLATMPEHLRLDDLTNWLFAFQLQTEEAYEYSVAQWRQTGSQLWLATAISKATKDSPDVARLLEAAEKFDRREPAYPTVAYNYARVLIDAGKTAEARRLIDGVLDSTADLPVSTRNAFLTQRAGLTQTLDDFLRYSLLTPFAYDFDGESGTIDEFVARQKSWYDPETFTDKTREQYEKEVDEMFAAEKEWQGRPLFDSGTIAAINTHFPTTLLAATEASKALPDYMHERFAVAVWTRAILLEDYAAAARMQPELLKLHPELTDLVAKIDAAATPLAKKRAALYVIYRNPMLTPFVEDSFGRTDNTFNNYDSNDWWCGPYYDDSGDEVEVGAVAPKPPFLSPAQSAAAKAERAKLDAIGDAPKYLGEKALEWSRLAPADKRVPELLYIMWEANGWTKYGCGNNEELRAQLGATLKRRFPQSEWTQKMLDVEKDENP